MKNEYKIILILILIILFLLYNKKNEHLFVASEPVINIAKVYADASGTVNFNNIKLEGKISSTNNNLDISANTTTINNLNLQGKITSTNNNLDISANTTTINNLNLQGKILSTNNNLDISANINTNAITTSGLTTDGIVNGYMLTMQGVDIRYYLPGVTLYSMTTTHDDGKLYNSLSKVDLQLGHYSANSLNTLLGDTDWNDKANVIIVYPGFGVSLYTDYADFFNGNNCDIDNYGIKPLRIKLGTPPTVYAGNSSEQQFYNVDSNTYTITGTGVDQDQLSILIIRFASDDAKWRKHNIN
jgi:hypothetical protein